MDRPIFRPEALRHFASRGDQAVYPQMHRPRLRSYLWLLGALFAGAAAATWTREVPILSRGVVVVSPHAAGGGEAIVILPANDLRCMTAGRPVLVRPTEDAPAAVARLAGGGARLMSPYELRSRFDTRAEWARDAATRRAVAAVRLPAEVRGQASAGDYYAAQVEVGRRTVGSLLRRRPLACRERAASG